MNDKKEKVTNISRRKFVIGISATGTGLMLGLFPEVSTMAKMLDGNVIESFTPSIWVTIDKDNTITITNSRSEMGQGIKTSLAMALADTMDADWNNVRVAQAVADTKYGSQSTGGSYSIMSRLEPMMQAGAIVRKMLITAAAQTWNIDESECKADKGYVLEISGSRKLSYGDLTDLASTLKVPSSTQVKSPADYIYIGTKKGHIDNHDIITGKAIFGIDVVIPGMKYACIAFPPAIGASVISYTDTETLKIAGVIKTLKISAGVTVIAENTYAAMKGVETLNITWDMGSNSNLSSDAIFQNFKKGIGTLPSLPGTTVKTIEAEYQLPYLAHATMEPQNCTVNYTGTSCEVWVPTQDSQAVQSAVASKVGLKISNVIVHTTLIGGGFGRRLSTDYASLAAEISGKANLPIKLTYTRNDDIKQDHYRPASIHTLKAGLDSSGKLTGWIHKSVGESSLSPPYKLPGAQNLTGSGYSPVLTGAWRSVNFTQNVFANESFIDEIAYSAGVDPLDFRLGLSNNEKITGVLNELKTRSDWGKPLPKGSGRGVAVFYGFGSYAGHVIEVSVDNQGKLTIDRVIAVIDVGIAVNPNMIEAQLMGAVIDGLSTALKAEITIKNGIVEQSNFHDFPWLRINESPKIETYILQSGNFIGGMGEPGFPTVSPALCNAIFNAVGVRIRKLPIASTPLTGIEEKKRGELNFEVYPNPFIDKLTIKLPGINPDGKIEINIYDILGVHVFGINLKSDYSNGIMETISPANLLPGAYNLILKSDNNIFRKSIIKV